MTRHLPKSYRTSDETDAFALAELRIEMARADQARELSFMDLGYLTKLPESIGQLTELRSLDLTNNRLTALPDSLAQLTQLQNLNLSRNRFVELPPVVGQLARLQILNLSRNQVIELPSFIGQFAEMQRLYLSRNRFSRVPESIARLTKLRELYLSKNQLTELPEAVRELVQLRILDLFENQLTELPEIIGQLRQLRELYLQNNQLTELPEIIGQLKLLSILSLAGNKLSRLPESIGQIEQLSELNLTDNKLDALPDSLQNLKSLQRLYLHGNNLKLDHLVLGAPIDDVIRRKARPAHARRILDFYFRSLDSVRPLNEAKLILVGRGGVGKTSLVNQLIFKRFRENVKETRGININFLNFQLKNQEKVRLNVWDFGGQEIMHGTHQFFLTKRSLYLLVLSGREGNADNDAEYWLKLIESYGANSPVIIVLNKIDEHRFDLNRTALLNKYGNIIQGFIETDCKTTTGLRELFNKIKSVTSNLEDLRTPFPAVWFSIKEKLGELNKDYIRFTDYRRICEEAGEQDEHAKITLADYLNDLGVIFNKNNQSLRDSDTYVLSPHWITNGIYAIINSEKIKKRKGKVYLNDLKEILDPDRYPLEKHEFLIELMKDFKLCFGFPDQKDCYLIPDLLDKNEPPEIAEFDREKCLHFEYRYSVLPEGLMPRFITQTYNLSEGQSRWRSGVILSFARARTRALVKADLQERKILISVEGENEPRRELLNIIRDEFENIHPYLKPAEYITFPEYPDTPLSYQELLKLKRLKIHILERLIGDEMTKIDVLKLLEAVDFVNLHRKEHQSDGTYAKKINLFFSYSHKDEILRDELYRHIILLKRKGWIDVWHDRKIRAGKDWEGEIDDNLKQADIVLLLVSADFIASDYCYEKEMKFAVRRSETTVIPVIVRDCIWRIADFAHLKCLPEDGKAVVLWDDRDSAWRNVSEGIQAVVEEIHLKTG